MKITRRNLSEYAGHLLLMLDVNKVQSQADFDRLIGRKYGRVGTDADHVSFSLVRSNFGTKAHALSYISEGKGVVIELRINLPLDYTQAILKSVDGIDNYLPFAADAFGNIAQARSVHETGIGLARKLLTDIVELGKIKE